MHADMPARTKSCWNINIGGFYIKAASISQDTARKIIQKGMTGRRV